MSDLRGDVREMRDVAGDPFARFDYDAYGNLRAEELFETPLIDEELAGAIARIHPLRYAGYVFDSDTELYYCSQRYYDLSIGAFISKDPAKADGQLSFYSYCSGDPINQVDDQGLAAAGFFSYKNKTYGFKSLADSLNKGYAYTPPGITFIAPPYDYSNGFGIATGPAHFHMKFQNEFTCIECKITFDRSTGKPIVVGFNIPVSRKANIPLGSFEVLLGGAAAFEGGPVGYYFGNVLYTNGLERFMYGVGQIDASYPLTVPTMSKQITDGDYRGFLTSSAEALLPIKTPIDLMLIKHKNDNREFSILVPSSWRK